MPGENAFVWATQQQAVEPSDSNINVVGTVRTCFRYILGPALRRVVDLVMSWNQD
jgi:hypothetical protein